mmetsp:Transcript_122197/g.225119  ORF Transcript_122197/g.225119 Transcript_122197/m.225119 type:complete len:1080 (-) Transcript_122197:67-3306(-)
MEDGDKPKKAHKKRMSGKKAQKKKEKQQGGKVEKHNPRAHTFSGGVRSVQKRVQFTLDKQANKERAERVNKTPEVPPPFIVVVQGPPGVGKTTLVKSLVRHYAKQSLLNMRGPVTLVSGRQRRLTIIECPQEMSAMLDLAKVADLVLLLIDASFGFELETFEFINILQVHGFPRVIGVLTHLDGFRENKQLRKVKKTMKHRFWTEVYDGAKVFYLSGLQHGRYARLEIQNLARFIAVQKASILSWRQSHPYILALRWEDQTPPAAAANTPRMLDLYGYVYGGRLREGSQAHLAGIGDFQIEEIKTLPDPCPLPEDVEAERRLAKGADKEKEARRKSKNALRSLAERHRVVYAPGSDVGSITVDSDAMYIQLPEHQVGFTRREDETADNLPEAVRMVRELQEGGAAVAPEQRSLRLLGSGATVTLADDEAMQGRLSATSTSTASSSRRPAPAEDARVSLQSTARRRSVNGTDEDGDDEEDSEEEEEEDDEQAGDMENDGGSDEEHRQSVLQRARLRFERAPRLEEVIYGNALLPESKGQMEAPAKDASASKATDHATIPLFDDAEDLEVEDGSPGDIQESTPRVVRGTLGNMGEADGVDTVRMVVLPGEAEPWDDERKEQLKERKFITGGWSSAEEDMSGDEEGAKTAEKAADGAAADGDNAADGEARAAGEEGATGSTSGALDAASFLDGAAIATFVRVRLQGVPAACVAEMRRERPLLLGGLLPGELRMGMVQVRVKRHRWHPKLLKSDDALLLSIGWRRYQTLPTFSLEDRGEKRMRFLKYTLEHAHCMMTCYGPVVPPNTGVMAFRSFDKVSHFRVSATGGVMESAADFEIKKKLKLVGEPYKIFRNTAFVKGMFTSDLEVSKYLHAKIQTVSGIRGEVKKPEGTRGSFRATFEDRILMSDLVICKCWINVEPRNFYHPVVDVAGWRAARLIGELRATAGVPVPDNKDSRYGAQHVRPERKFNPLKIPKRLEEALPFKTKTKNSDKQRKTALQKKAAIVSSERDHAINSLLNRLYTVRKEKHRIRKDASAKKKAVKEKQDKFIQDKRDAVTKELRKKRYIKQGMQESQRRKAMKME